MFAQIQAALAAQRQEGSCCLLCRPRCVWHTVHNGLVNAFQHSMRRGRKWINGFVATREFLLCAVVRLLNKRGMRVSRARVRVRVSWCVFVRWARPCIILCLSCAVGRGASCSCCRSGPGAGCSRCCGAGCEWSRWCFCVVRMSCVLLRFVLVVRAEGAVCFPTMCARSGTRSELPMLLLWPARTLIGTLQCRPGLPPSQR